MQYFGINAKAMNVSNILHMMNAKNDVSRVNPTVAIRIVIIWEKKNNVFFFKGIVLTIHFSFNLNPVTLKGWSYGYKTSSLRQQSGLCI
jgi:hypothetical protein